MTATQMINAAGMKTIYRHLESDPHITHAIQVHGGEGELAEVGEFAMREDVHAFAKAFQEKRFSFYQGDAIPESQMVYCLYLPPYYFFVDAKKEWK